MSSFTAAQALVANESDGKIQDEGRELECPVPMSPFAGELSKEVELQRALVAEAAMQSGPAVGRESVLFEDEWIMIVNKPRGLYCEHVFATVPSLLSSSGTSLTVTHCLHEPFAFVALLRVQAPLKDAMGSLSLVWTSSV